MDSVEQIKDLQALLKVYKDAEEQGRLAICPLKVNDNVFFIAPTSSGFVVIRGKVVGWKRNGAGEINILAVWREYDYDIQEGHWFITQQEAEERLEKIKK